MNYVFYEKALLHIKGNEGGWASKCVIWKQGGVLEFVGRNCG